MLKFFAALLAALAALAAPLLLISITGSPKFIGYILPLAAAPAFALLMLKKIGGWLRSPVPYNVSLPVGQMSSNPDIPGSALKSPATRRAALARLTLDALTFRPLWRNVAPRPGAGPESGPDYARSAGLAWLAIIFHGLILLIVLGHIRYFWPDPPAWFFIVDPPKQIFGIAFAAAGALLIIRRLRGPARIYSRPADFWPLLLLLNLTGTGLALSWTNFDSAQAELWLGSLYTLEYREPKLPNIFYIHLFQFIVLLLCLPQSKFTHGLAIWLMPTLNQPNNGRALRHINPMNPTTPERAYADYEKDNYDSLKAAGLEPDRRVE